jgi:hypothetical protein
MCGSALWGDGDGKARWAAEAAPNRGLCHKIPGRKDAPAGFLVVGSTCRALKQFDRLGAEVAAKLGVEFQAKRPKSVPERQ